MIKVRNGIDNLDAIKAFLSDNRLGLITNMSGVTYNLRPSYEVLHDSFKLTELFAPEHGLRGAAQAGKQVGDDTESYTGLPVRSLYGDIKAPTDEMLEDVDILCFDMQDVGARFYTYLYTMTRSMKVAAAHNIPFVVFDRMNPLSASRVEGEILDEANSSFVGEYAVPTRYGLTIGEFARYVNETHHLGCDLHVVPCVKLDRLSYIRDTDLPWVAPSPNMPTPETALAYIGTCIFESVKNVSEGRGTTQPFEMIGSPAFDGRALAAALNAKKLGGVLFRSVYFTPTFSKFQGEMCEGVQLHITNRDEFSPFAAGVTMLEVMRSAYSLDINEKSSYRLFGTSRLYDGVSAEKLIEDSRISSEKFRAESSQFMIY